MGRRPQGIAQATRVLLAARLWLATGSAAVLVSCAGPGPGGASTKLGNGSAGILGQLQAPTGAVVVRLAFHPSADLDLYVTGPLEETVYFANTPSKIGGRLEADLRCDSPTPGLRVETVVFPTSVPGRYRVGVDFPEACNGGRGDVAFSVETRSANGVDQIDGRIEPGVFDPVVLEWLEPEVGPTGDPVGP